MFSLNKRNITRSYNYSKKEAGVAFRKGNPEDSLEYIELSARIAYQFNWIYADEELEKLLENISNVLIDPVANYKPIQSRFVFYDTFSTDNRALTQQYIRALMSMGRHFLYITESTKSNRHGQHIFSELAAYDKVEIFEVSQSISRTEQISIVYQKIVSYLPDKLFIHTHPWSVVAFTAFYALPKEIIRYKINLTDHAFWLGNNALDYSIEFRARGCTLSKEMRHIPADRILLLPYYPVINEISFKGFPEISKGKVIIFSGSSFYKVYGKNGEFFKLVKQLLNENPESVLLFAGAGEDTPIIKFIKENNFEQRFILIGNRIDINEVFKHCDIFLGTFPFGGGLMTQYAALHTKPILAYTTPELDGKVESFVCHHNNVLLTFTDKNLFFEEARRLIGDAEYRRKKGSEVKDCMITQKQFDELFVQTISDNKSVFTYSDVSTNHEARFQLYLEQENNFQFDYKRLIVDTFRFKTVFLFPKIFFWFLCHFLARPDLKMIERKFLSK